MGCELGRRVNALCYDGRSEVMQVTVHPALNKPTGLADLLHGVPKLGNYPPVYHAVAQQLFQSVEFPCNTCYLGCNLFAKGIVSLLDRYFCHLAFSLTSLSVHVLLNAGY